MAWIKSYQELERHPKTLQLMSLMDWDNDTAIAKLHRVWWWCLDYAENGDLTKYSPEVLANCIGIDQKKSNQFLEVMCSVGFFDKEPYLRVHDWWEFAGAFFITKYKQHPEKWNDIKSLYSSNNSCNNSSKEVQDKIRKDKIREDKEHCIGFESFWSLYPRKTAKPQALKAFLKISPNDELLQLILSGVEKYKKTDQWKKNSGEFIPHPATFLNQKRWQDEIKIEKPNPYDGLPNQKF